jgi:quinol monooxygenase YgiN
MIIVTGSATARPGSFDDVLALSVRHVRRSRLEPGCLSHEVYRDVEQPQRVVFLERWADRDALQAHFEVPESLAFVEALGRLTSEPPTMEIHTVTDR